MRRLLLAALLVTGCDSVYHMFQFSPGDGGPPATNGTGIGGMVTPDLSGSSNGDLGQAEGGLINLQSRPGSSEAAAKFGASGCVGTVIADCTLIDCSSDLGAGMATFPTAGTIHISGGATDVFLTPALDGSYAPQSYLAPLWSASAGALLTVAATGANFPAFTTTVNGPIPVDITNPLAVSALDVARNVDFNFSWTGGTTGRVTSTITVGAQSLVCDFPLSFGSAIVPAQALMRLPAGIGTVDLAVADSILVDTSVVVLAETPARDSSGAAFSVAVTLR